MSWENMEKFFKLMLDNEEVRAKMKSFGGDLDALAAYAKELGYDFSLEELREGRDRGLKIFKAVVEKKLQQADDSVSPGVQAFYDFIKLAETDAAVAAQVAEIGAGTPEKIIAYGKEKGFIFTEEDMKSAAGNILDASNELSDEELEAATGGILATAAAVSSVVSAVVGVASLGVAAASTVLAAASLGIAAATLVAGHSTDTEQ